MLYGAWVYALIEVRREPVQKSIPALDEAMEVLKEYSKDLEQSCLTDAVAQQLEAHCVPH